MDPQKMNDRKNYLNRSALLADVAEMYYLDGMNQEEIARQVGVTRSMVSRMLTEARQKGIVEVRVRRPILYDHNLECALIERFGLLGAQVVSVSRPDPRQLLYYIGKAGADLLLSFLQPETVLGIAWGTSVSSVVDQIEFSSPAPLKIVQLVGALGSRNKEYDGHGLVTRLVEKLDGEAYYLNAPFICPTPEVAASLLEAHGVVETIQMADNVTLALVGVGTTDPDNSSFYLAGYVPLEELEKLIEEGAVGDVCGLHFDLQGEEICDLFCRRLVTIQLHQLKSIPVKVGVAGGGGKVASLLGALRGGYLNALATDSLTAASLLELADQT